MATKLKNRQHHVCQAYLRGWATDGKVWVLQGDLLHRAHTKDVAVQNRFYKLQALTDFDIAFIRKFIEKSPAHSRRSHENFLTMFGMFPTLRARMSKEQAAANPALTAYLDEQIVNAEEEFHSGIETQVAPQLEALRGGDIKFFGNDKQAAQFAHFLALQHFRTIGIKSRALARTQAHADTDISRRWNVLSHIFASNVGWTVYAERKRSPLVLIDNATDVPLITSDQPAVNLLGGSNTEKPPDHLALYYPVSSRFGVLFDDADNPCGLAGKSLSPGDVKGLNTQIVRNSYRQIIAADSSILAEIAADRNKAA
jgi:hypothetical protein